MDQFYNLLNPSPEEEKDLDEETETYIRNAVEDLTPEERKRARIVLYLSPHQYQNSNTRKKHGVDGDGKLCVPAVSREPEV